MTFLPDVNVWLALTFESHIHHASAKQWFERLPASDRCVFCRLTQQGFLRLATNPRAFANEAVTLQDAWRLYDLLVADPRIEFADEPIGIELPWRRFTSTRTFSPKVWNDAFLVAIAERAGYQLVTFDQGLRQYADVACMVLNS